MLRYKRLLKLIFSMMLICCMSITVCAQNVPDMSQKGNITVNMRYNGNVVSGGNLTIYKVATLQESGGTYKYVLTDEFAGSGISTGNLESADSAKTLSTYATKHSITGTTQTIGSSGSLSYTDLELGVYLFVQGYSATGYMQISPFLVTVPTSINGNYNYNVNADPKLEVRKRSGSSGGGSGSGNSSGGSSSSTTTGKTPTSTSSPTSTSTPTTDTPKNRSITGDPEESGTTSSSSPKTGTTSENGTNPSGDSSTTLRVNENGIPVDENGNPIDEQTLTNEASVSENPEQQGDTVSSSSSDAENPKETAQPKLPQTGQLNWPIPVLVVLGLGAFTASWILRFGKSKQEEGKNNQ
jgi:hypothetical protein